MTTIKGIRANAATIVASQDEVYASMIRSGKDAVKVYTLAVASLEKIGITLNDPVFDEVLGIVAAWKWEGESSKLESILRNFTGMLQFHTSRYSGAQVGEAMALFSILLKRIRKEFC